MCLSICSDSNRTQTLAPARPGLPPGQASAGVTLIELIFADFFLKFYLRKSAIIGVISVLSV
jgi:hypothetical protein